MKKFLLPLLIAFTFNAFAQSQRFYVRSNASGANNGSSWQDAFADLQHALAAAQAGDSIWVAEGSYLPTSTNDRTISFKVKSGVRLFGGFAGDETAFAERDWEAHPVELSGNLGSFVLFTDNSLHIMTLENPDSTTVVDGFDFRYGNANSGNQKNGSAISVSVQNNAGFSALRVRNCLFQLNWATESGGAVQVFSQGHDYSRFENCEFVNNDARTGGAVFVSASAIYTEFIGCRFIYNVSKEVGGAVAVNGPSNAVRFFDCRFEKNRTDTGSGGALFCAGKSLPEKGPVVESCQFLENRCALNNSALNGQTGGAVYFWDKGGQDTIRLADCYFFKNNSAAGAAAYFNLEHPAGSNIEINNCRFEENGVPAGNTVSINGSTIRSVVMKKSVFQNQQQSMLVINGNGLPAPQQSLILLDSCVFLDNEGLVYAVNVSGNCRSVMSNSIVKNNKVGDVLMRLFAKECSLQNSIFEKNEGMYWFLESENSTVDVNNCLFRKNQTYDFMFGFFSGVLHVANCLFDSNVTVEEYATIWYSGECAIKNSTFINNKAVTISNDSISSYLIPGYLQPYFQHCYFDAPLDAPVPAFTYGPGNLTGLDPMFEGATTGDFHLQACSPLVGAGGNAAVAGLVSDLDGTPRIQGGTVDIGIFEKAAPNLAVAPLIKASCPGQQTGSVGFQPENGCEPYLINWSSGSTSGQSPDDLAAGDYIFNIQDARGALLSLPITIPENPVPILVPITTPVTCGDTSGGSATLIADGAAPFSFLWPDGSTDTLQTDLAAGAYPVQITDAEGCIGIDNVIVTTQGRLKASVKIDKITCPGYADGSLAVTPKSGLAPFRWLWETGDTTASIAGLGPGLYHLTLTDALGCEIAWMIPLIEPTVDCFGEAGAVFPNPFSDYLTVRTEFVPDETSRWVLKDALGRVLLSTPLSDIRTRVTFADMSAGIYFWQLWHGGQLLRAGRVEKLE